MSLKSLSLLILLIGIVLNIYPPNSINPQNIDVSLMNNALKTVGIKEYSKEEIVDKITINTNDIRLTKVIKNALLNTDNNTLKYIESVNVVKRNVVSNICGLEAMGCANTKYLNDKLSSSDIYLSELSEYIGLCGSFSFTLFHEIGHVVYAKEYGYINAQIYYSITTDSSTGKQTKKILKSDETYADNYASNYAKDRCNSDKYIELNNRLEELTIRLNESNQNVESTKIQLDYWNKYGYAIPSEMYNLYLKDYNNHAKAVDEYNIITNEYNHISNQINEYIDSDEDII